VSALQRLDVQEYARALVASERRFVHCSSVPLPGLSIGCTEEPRIPKLPIEMRRRRSVRFEDGTRVALSGVMPHDANLIKAVNPRRGFTT
jgi:hypothetical protein